MLRWKEACSDKKSQLLYFLLIYHPKHLIGLQKMFLKPYMIDKKKPSLGPEHHTHFRIKSSFVLCFIFIFLNIALFLTCIYCGTNMFWTEKYPDLTNWASLLYIPAIIGREWEMGTAWWSSLPHSHLHSLTLSLFTPVSCFSGSAIKHSLRTLLKQYSIQRSPSSCWHKLIVRLHWEMNLMLF